MYIRDYSGGMFLIRQRKPLCFDYVGDDQGGILVMVYELNVVLM